MEPLLTSGLLVYMAAGIDLLSLAVIGREALMYEAWRQNALGMALICPILVTFLTFIVSGASHNILISLFITVSDLGVVHGNIVMGNIAVRTSCSFMFML